MIEPREYCHHCNTTTPSRRVDHASGTEWLCVVCGLQVDFDIYDDWDDDCGEPTGCCAECECNLYDDDGPLCSQCEFYLSMGASRSKEHGGCHACTFTENRRRA